MSVQIRKNGKLLALKRKKEETKTRERNPEKNEKEPRSGPGNNAQTRKPVTVIAGDSIIQNIRGSRLSKTNKVIVKPFPGATTEDMEDFIKPILRKDPENIIIHVGINTGSPSSKYEHRRASPLLRNIQNKDLYGKKPIVSVTYEKERISIKNSLPYLKYVLRLSCVVHGLIYGRFMGFYVNSFLSM